MQGKQLQLPQSVPRKDRRSASHVDLRVLEALRAASSLPSSASCASLDQSAVSAAAAGVQINVVDEDSGPINTLSSPERTPPPFQKHNKSEIDNIYAHLKAPSSSRKSKSLSVTKSANGSLSSTDFGSTMSSAASFGLDPEMLALVMGPGIASSAAAWSLRWQIDSVGKEPGQIRCAKDVCITRGDGNFVAVTDSLNARVQMFSVNSGRLLAVLGVDSSDSRTSKSFSKYSQRRMKVSACDREQSNFMLFQRNYY